MKVYHTYLFKILSFFILINIISNIFCQTSTIYPLYKLIIAEDVERIGQPYTYSSVLDLKGIGIIFNNSYNISVMPYRLLSFIHQFYKAGYDDIGDYFEKLPNGYYLFSIISSLYKYETIHFILENLGIAMPLNVVFMKVERENEYNFRFFGDENIENIIIGKDLIELMDINFKPDNDFTINNDSFILKVKD